MHIKYGRGPTAEGTKVAWPRPSLVVLTSTLFYHAQLRGARLVRNRTSRGAPTRERAGIRLRPSVLDRPPVLLRGVEASIRSCVRASYPDPLYHTATGPVPSSVAGGARRIPVDRESPQGLCVHPVVVGLFMLPTTRISSKFSITSQYLPLHRLRAFPTNDRLRELVVSLRPAFQTPRSLGKSYPERCTLQGRLTRNAYHDVRRGERGMNVSEQRKGLVTALHGAKCAVGGH